MYHKINHICMAIRMGKIYIHLLVTHITLARDLHGTKGEMLRKRNDTSNSPQKGSFGVSKCSCKLHSRITCYGSPLLPY